MSARGIEVGKKASAKAAGENSSSSEANRQASFPANESRSLGEVPYEQKAHCVAAELSNNATETSERRPHSPIDVLLFWHKAIRRELKKFAQEAKQLHSSPANLPKFSEHLQFLAEVCIFHR